MFKLTEQDKIELTEFLQALVRTPSLSGQEGDVARLLVSGMKSAGFRQVFIDRIGNAVGRVGDENGPMLLYNGHMDTVGVTDPAAWEHDPYGAIIENGTLFGRGACDMKGALAAMIWGTKLLDREGLLEHLRGELVVAGVVQEEPCEGLGMQFLVEEENLRPDWVVLGEATNLQLSRGHRGRLEIEVAAHGRSSHASRPDLGENAVYNAAHLICAIENLSQNMRGNDDLLGPGSLAVVLVESQAGSRNVIPNIASFVIDRRLTLGETETMALAEVGDALAKQGLDAVLHVTEYKSTSYTGYQAKQRNYFPAWSLEADHPLVQKAVHTVQETLGYQPSVGKWDFGTDASYTMGVAGIPTIGFGPGDEANAHTVNDQIRLEDVFKAALVYAHLALEFLG